MCQGMFSYPGNLLSGGFVVGFVFFTSADYHWIPFPKLELFGIFQKYRFDLKRLAKRKQVLRVMAF